MKTTRFSYTMSGLLRRVFGHVDGRVASPISNWGAILSKGTRDWAAAEELVRIGVAVIVQRDNGFFYCRRAADETGAIELRHGETMVVESAGEDYERKPERAR